MATDVSALAEMAKDPALVPGVYNYCDQWCSYCGMSGRCLVFRARGLWEARNGCSSREGTDEAVAFTREVGRADGQGSPQLDAILSGAWRRMAAGSRKTQPVERLAARYAAEASAFLAANRWRPAAEAEDPRSGQPPLLDVVGFYHMLIWVKIMRAIDGKVSSDAGERDWRVDARGSAKVALVAIDRSQRALELLEKEGAADAGSLLARLCELESLVEEIFPDARSFIRVGLDAAVV